MQNFGPSDLWLSSLLDPQTQQPMADSRPASRLQSLFGAFFCEGS